MRKESYTPQRDESKARQAVRLSIRRHRRRLVNPLPFSPLPTLSLALPLTSSSPPPVLPLLSNLSKSRLLLRIDRNLILIVAVTRNSGSSIFWSRIESITRSFVVMSFLTPVTEELTNHKKSPIRIEFTSEECLTAIKTQ